MILDKWHPLREIEGMRFEMDRIWDELFPRGVVPAADMALKKVSGRAEREETAPAIDIIDQEAEVLVRVEMPGVDKTDIEVTVLKDVLTVRGTIKAAAEDAGKNYYYSERTYKAYSRSIKLPLKVDPEKIKAKLANGILTVHLPKSEATKEKKITVDIK